MAAIFKTAFSNASSWMKMNIIRLKYHWSLLLIMAWCRPGDKSLSEPLMVCLPTHICVTRSQRVDLITGEVKVGMRYYIPLIYVDVITYPCLNANARLSDVCECKRPLYVNSDFVLATAEHLQCTTLGQWVYSYNHIITTYTFFIISSLMLLTIRFIRFRFVIRVFESNMHGLVGKAR